MKIIDRHVATGILVTAGLGVLILSLVLVLGNIFRELLNILVNNPDVPILTVLGFIANSVAISSSVLGRHARNSYTRRCIAFSVFVSSESAAAAEVGEPLTLGARAAKSGSGVLSMS
jgi:hypothetical protein